MVVGLTGGIGSGKTEVAAVFSQLGALVIDTDALAREVVEPGSDALRDIANVWPDVVQDGVLDRQALARIVFNDEAARIRLQNMLHPRIRRLAQVRSAAAAPGQLVVQVIPLLFEAGLETQVDRIIVVRASDTARIARVAARDAARRDDILARMAAQIDPDEAASRADAVIENDGDLESLRKQTAALYASLRV